MSHHKFKDQTLLDFNVKLSRLDWSTVFQSSDTNNAYGNFCKIYTNTIKTVRFKQKPCGKTMDITRHIGVNEQKSEFVFNASSAPEWAIKSNEQKKRLV